MDMLLQALGLVAAENPKSARRLYLISNPDGSPRWIWNAENTRPDFLRFYAVNNLRSFLFSLAIKVVFLLRIQRLFFGRKNLVVNVLPNQPLSAFLKQNFAVFTGTAGPNRKLVLFAKGQFVKISLNRNSFRLVENEKTQLSQTRNGSHFGIPSFADLDKGFVALSDMGTGKRPGGFSALHAKALTELQSLHPNQELAFGETAAFWQVKKHLEQGERISEHLLPKYLREKLMKLADDLGKERLYTTFAHGDFTSWNSLVSKGKIKMYDFELAREEMPFGFDAFHFVIQQGILVDHLPYQAIKPKLKQAFDLMTSGKPEIKNSFETYFKAYLLVNTAYYLQVYAEQPQWHLQVNWLLNTWNDAISDMLSFSQEPRRLVIGDVFDFLKNSPHATVKFPEIDPRDLDHHADIDLLTSRNTAFELDIWLSNHSLVRKVDHQRRSNMLSLLLVLEDGSTLALDLIWKLKVRHLEFMSVPNAISRSVVNKYGLQILHLKDLQTYLSCFYGLNGAQIPQKYQCYFSEVANHKGLQESVADRVRNLPSNKGWSAAGNNLSYFLDSLRMLLRRKGLILTFSGVDGAGKSTVIEHTRQELEKKLRRRVKVIRHRPSLLPILSAWTSGKEKAEQKAASTLPRQGTNRSLLSSLFRFGYYYLDYLFGQFYIYLRYVNQGYVVLYDRYYFDFINDSLRSNIVLPKWLTRAGYRLLLKPNLNFFLYADAQIILSRKKELDAFAIKQLTQDYISLFSELGRRDRDKYYAIENIQIDETIAFITSKTQAQLV
jgi:thymidylate kinase